jgi:hypothetical protein
MKRTALLLAAIITVSGGCRTLVHMQQSAFFSGFVLDKSVKATGYKGTESNSGVGGGSGIGGSGGGIGTRGVDVHSSSTSTAGFSIIEEGENRFQESQFIAALASQIEKEIEETHAGITGRGNPTPNEFYFDYKDGNIKGRISVSGAVQGRAYIVNADIDENNKP